MQRRIVILIACAIGLLCNARADLKLPAIFGDDMVLQRGIELPVWGWADAGEEVRVQFAGQTKLAVADGHGRWQLKLEPLAVLPEPEGMTVIGSCGGQRVFRNVLVGDVWICSGQSNMQFPVANTLNGQQEAAKADLPGIRLFFMPNVTALTPQADCAGGWRVCGPESAAQFSAVGFFFGRHLHRELQVPVGLIGTSWGGTIAEAWTSASALHSSLPEFDEPVAQVLSSAEALNKAIHAYQVELTSFGQFMEELFRIEEDLESAVLRTTVEYDDTAWPSMALPGNWEERGLTNLNGIVWFRRTIELPAAWAGKDLVLRLGPIDEVDVTWFNGRQVGARGRSRTREVSFWNVPREYPVPGDVVRGGTNVIAIRVSDMAGQGGLWGAPADSLRVELADGSDCATVSLAGDWRYEVEYVLPPKPNNPESPSRPTVLFNAMINPLIPYGVAGAIWYQGESNVTRPKQYRTLLPTLIADWRQRWGQGDFPFLVVQLANFREMKDQPDESSWAELREAQAQTAMADPKVGLAVTIDIGDAKDIHPKNKQDVGRRLGLAAQAIAHGQAVPSSGPVYANMSVANGKATLAFTHTDGGLVARGGALTGFAIAGADRRFVWAQARIEGDKVVVWSPDVAEPSAVRYAWADNPDCNLYNGADLPAVPFRTDHQGF